MTAFGGTRSPNIFITNGLEMGTPTFLERGAFPDERRWQFADTMTYVRGRHTFKFGADINKVTDDISNLRFEAGAYSYTGTNALADFIMDFTNWRNPGPDHCRREHAPEAVRGLSAAAMQVTISRESVHPVSSSEPGTTISFLQDDFRVSSASDRQPRSSI